MFTLAGGHSAGGRGRGGPQGLENLARRLQLSPRVAQGHPTISWPVKLWKQGGTNLFPRAAHLQGGRARAEPASPFSTGSPQHPRASGTAGKPNRHPRHLGETDRNIRGEETASLSDCTCNTRERTIPLLGHSLRRHRRTQPRRQEVSCFHSEHHFVTNNPGIPSLPVGFSVLDFLYLPHQEGSDQKK